MEEKTPRNVRNFWLEVEVDGRKKRIACGPVNKQGGMRIVLRQRNKGKVERVLIINCQAITDMETNEMSLSTYVTKYPSDWDIEIPMIYATER